MPEVQPLVPPDVDLRGLDYMPLFGNHLFGSEFNAAASDSEWRAAITLWWAAWNQVPAGSLPDDDAALCRLADLGRDVKTWKKLRERALHGFTRCTDGRLYHEFLCQQAVIAWDKRVKERQRKAKWRADQDAKKRSVDADVPGTNNGTEKGTSASEDATVRADGTGKDGTGRDGVKDKGEGTARKRATPPPDRPDDVAEQTWGDWTRLRKEKRASVSETVLAEAATQAQQAGVSLDRFLRSWCGAGWQGYTAKQYREREGATPRNGNHNGETAYQRSMRERMQAVVPSIAARAPGADSRPTAEVFDVSPRRLDR